MFIDFLPVWVLFFVTVALVLLSVEIGFRLGRNVRGKTEDERESPVSSIAGVILGLQAFMLAFTFGMVSDRYEAKKAMVRAEAEAIRTTWRRSDFLQEVDRPKIKALLDKYVEERLALSRSRDFGSLETLLADARRMHQEMWTIAVTNGRTDLNSDIGALFVESVNEIEALHARRVGVAITARIPTTIWFTLVSLLTLGMLGLGYHTAIANSRRSRVTPVLAFAFSVVVALIAALDHPGDTLVPISQQPLANVLAEMRAASGNQP